MSRRTYLLLAGVLVLGAVPRLTGLDAKGLWYDEAVSASFLDFSAREIIERCAEPRATHPPLFFLLLKAWAGLGGTSEFALRLPAVVFGLATVAGVFALTRDLSGSWAGEGRSNLAACMAGVLVALSPLHIQLSQQVRGYSMSLALQAWCGWALLRALRGGRDQRAYWVAASLLAAGSCYTHYLALFSTLAQGLFGTAYLASRPRRPDPEIGPPPSVAWALVACGIFAAGFLLPWQSHLFAQARTVGRHVPGDGFPTAKLAARLSQAILGTFTSPWQGPDVGSSTILGILVLVGVVLACRWGWPGWYLVLIGFLPIAPMILYTRYSHWSMTEARYFGFASLSWLSGLALISGRAARRPRSGMIPIALVALSLYIYSENLEVLGPYSRPGIRSATQFILDSRAPDEPIVAETPYVFFGACYYARNRPRPLLCATSPDRGLQHASEQLRDEDLVVPGALRMSRSPGVWLMACESFRPNGILDFELPPRWKLAETWSFDQDHPWESPVVVRHYVSGKATPMVAPPAQAASVPDAGGHAPLPQHTDPADSTRSRGPADRSTVEGPD